jgi:hypothetical protein
MPQKVRRDPAREQAECPSHQFHRADVQSKRMLMGFIGFGSTPPAPPPAEEPPGDEGGDDTGIRVTPAARPDRSLYRRRRAPAAGRYAWAISLGIHAAVLVGAFLAMKYYFRQPAPPKPSAVSEDSSGTGSILQSADSTDLVHGGLTITINPDAVGEQPFMDGKALPAFVLGEPRTIATLSDLAPGSGIDALQQGAITALGGAPVRSVHGVTPATQPTQFNPPQ